MSAIEKAYNDIRLKQQRALQERRESAYALSPILKEIDRSRGTLVRSLALGRTTADQVHAELARLAAEETSALQAAGLPLDTLTLQYDCPACRDTGYVGDLQRRPCRCRLMKQAKLDPRVRINDVETFPNFDANVYPSEEQCTQAKNAAALLETYANSLPHPAVLNYLILGTPGLGKSYLGNAIAYRALEKGIDAVRTTAYDFLEDVMAQLRGDPVSRNRFRNAELLVLDDIGTESVVPNVSENAFFSVIDSRIAKGLPTVYITNLTLKDLRDRYGDRIFSRLIDTKTTRYITLQGKNLRYGNR